MPVEDQAARLLEVAQEFAEAGCSVVPARANGTKAPAAFWRTYMRERPDTAQLGRWLTSGSFDGIGLVCGAISGQLELLELEGRAVDEGLVAAYEQLLADHGLTEVWRRVVAGYTERTPSGGIHVLLRVDGQAKASTKLARRPSTPEELAAWKAAQQADIDAGGDDEDDEKAEEVRARRQAALDAITRGEQVPQTLLETRGEGGYVVIAPSGGRTHPSGQAWTLLTGGPASIATVTEEERDALHAVATLLDTMPEQQEQVASYSSAPSLEGGNQEGRPGDDFNARTDWTEILEPHAWKVVGGHGRARSWRRPGKGLGISATTGRNDADNLYVFSSSTVFEPEKPYSKFAAYTLLEHGGDYAAAARELRRRGYGAPLPPRDDAAGLRDLIAPTQPYPSDADGRSVRTDTASDGNLATVTQLQPRLQAGGERTYQHSDDRNALDLVDRYGEQIRYCPDRGRWLTWDGSRWQWCEAGGGVVREHARSLARTLPDDSAAQAKFKAASLSARGIGSAVLLAQTDQRVVVPIGDLDARALHLNTPGGIVDLVTGDLAPLDPLQLHTRAAAVAPDHTMPTPRWDTFLADTFGGDAEMIAFAQRLAGYSASADQRHHVLPFAHGAGQNGKSVMMDVFRALLGDYATTAPPGFLMAGKQEHLAEVARLQGVRFVVASEVNQNSKFDEAKLKELTGGDTLTARFMRQDFFTFQPTHHLWLMANHKPQVKTGGDSFWRRLRLIPFNYRVPDDKKIENLAALLVREEGPGILAWIIRGAMDVFARGLKEPDSVMAETRAYAAEEDQLGRFLEERCHVNGNPQVRIESRILRQAYEQWCAQEGEQPMASSPLGRELKLRGIELVKANGKRFYTGVGLLVTDEEKRWDER